MLQPWIGVRKPRQGGASLFPCGDGSGKADRCPPEAQASAPCDPGIGVCRTRCSGGTFGYFRCGSNGTWIEGQSLFPCGGVTACSDGTGSTDCCWNTAFEGGGCDGSASRCSPTGCQRGFKSYLYCGSDGVWVAGEGLFACGADGGRFEGGSTGPVSCLAAGGTCVGVSINCTTAMPSAECNPNQSPTGGSCCLDPPDF